MRMSTITGVETQAEIEKNPKARRLALDHGRQHRVR
jgi:hypothetical protein